jgi:hypothetical protein
MERTKAIFEWIFGLGNAGYELSFLASPNMGLDKDVLEARKEKERKSLQSVESLRETYTSLRDVWHFLNEKHDMYTASKLVEQGRDEQGSGETSELVRESYGAP